MRSLRDSRKSREGAALFTVLVILFTMSALIATMTRVSLNRIHMTKKLSDRTRAIATAEAGLSHAMAVLITNYYGYSNAASFPRTAYNTGNIRGTYDVAVIDVTNGSLALISTGICNGAIGVCAVDVRDTGVDVAALGPPPGTAWEKTIFANGIMTVNGSGDAGGQLHSNNDLQIMGGLDFSAAVQVSSVTDIRITGDATSTNSTLTSPNITLTGTNVSNVAISSNAVPPIPMPALDLATFYNVAASNAQVYPGGTYIGQDWSGVPGGVVWIDGDLTIRDGFQIDGLLIVTGSITTIGNGNLDVRPGALGSGMISRDSEINIGGTHDITGLLYAPGDITMGGDISVEGQILSGGEVNLNGNITLLNYQYSQPGLGTPGVDNTMLGVAAWQR